MQNRHKKDFKTREYSSRMRTVRCSDCRGGVYLPRGVYLPMGVYLPGGRCTFWGCTCLGGTCQGEVYLPGGGCTCQGGVPARGCTFPGGCTCWGCTYLGGVLAGGGCLPKCMLGYPPMDRILDTRLLKHYLFATSFADGKNSLKVWYAAV